jgi:hypothetical protein
MATFNELAEGGALTGGCVVPKLTHRRQSYFGPGDIAYDARKARQGVLEPVAIKKHKMLWLGRSQSVLYIDTLNGMWNETDLVDFRTAAALAVEANLDQIAILDSQITC